ncbi:MAG: hypothetical protein IPN20_10660 [Haliscomenobacter sp.]|nr:hypothetical protein [Haliscomenobacter sp.]
MGVTRFLDFPGHHSIFYYLLAAVLTGIFLQALGIGGLFFLSAPAKNAPTFATAYC